MVNDLSFTIFYYMYGVLKKLKLLFIVNSSTRFRQFAAFAIEDQAYLQQGIASIQLLAAIVEKL